MIVHPTPDVLRVLFTLKGSIVKRIALRCLTITPVSYTHLTLPTN